MNTAARCSSFLRWSLIVLAVCGTVGLMSSTRVCSDEPSEGKIFRAGVAAVDISPVKLPVISSGSFLSRSSSVVRDRLFARSLVLDDGTMRIVLVVVDTLFVPQDLCDRVKAAASKKTGIPTENMLISATHCHSAGSLVGCLGTEADLDYVAQVKPQLVECIERSVSNLQPARIGWSSEIDERDTHCRVFIRRPDCIGIDPFGEKTVRVMMHPGYQNPEYIGPSGPVDNELSVLSVCSPDGKPIGILANYSMHYFGATAVSADYFGDFVRILTEKIAGGDSAFVAMISNGTSGDLHWMDYAKPRRNTSRMEYAESVAAAALRAYEKIEYHDWVPIRMVQRCIKLNRRLPDEERWVWAKAILDNMQSPVPANRTEVYAREAKYLREDPVRELKLQVIGIGNLGIAALPNETYALTGLKLKLRSPMSDVFTIELANGCEGYIPPPEALALGGYNAWPARTAGLQADAETIITDTLLSMFEQLSGKMRKTADLAATSYAKAILEKKPLAYWRLGEMDGTMAEDLSGANNHGTLEPGYLFCLDGPARKDLRCGDQCAHAIQFVGGRMKATLDALDDAYVVELFFWNGLPNDNRPVTGYLFSYGPNGTDKCPGDHLGISGTDGGKDQQGRLMFCNGNQRNDRLLGGSVIKPKTWNHLRLVRQGDRVRVYLNFNPVPDLAGRVPVTRPEGCADVFIGGRSDNVANFEGRIADVAIYPSNSAPGSP